MLRHGTLVLPDRGEGVCNAVYVDDVVDAMILTAQTPEAAGRRFLVSGEPITWGRFFEALAMAADAKPPAYLPVEAIRHEHKQRVGLAGLFRSPTMLLRRLAQRRSVGGLLRRASRLMPRPTRAHVERQLLGPLERRRAYRHLPDPGRLGLYQGRAVVSSGRARRELGYAPRVDLAAGMEITRRYLSTYFDRL
jgi:nucleoside-diphosphate-sugar epimerase